MMEKKKTPMPRRFSIIASPDAVYQGEAISCLATAPKIVAI